MGSTNSSTEKILIIGVGNTLRSDDGIGAYICSQMDALHLPDVTMRILHQLHIELIEDLWQYDSVIIADAAVTVKDVEFIPLQIHETQVLSSSHHLNANMLGALAQKIHGKNIPIFLCSVGGENFEMGETLSVKAMMNADNAVKLINAWIKNK